MERGREKRKEETQVTCKEKHTKATADFSNKTLKSRRTWSNDFQVLKNHHGKHRLIHPEKKMCVSYLKHKKNLSLCKQPKYYNQKTKFKEDTGISISIRRGMRIAKRL